MVEKKRTDQEQQRVQYNRKKKKKIFDKVVDYNDQLIICENCRRSIIVWDLITTIPTPKYSKQSLGSMTTRS